LTDLADQSMSVLAADANGLDTAEIKKLQADLVDWDVVNENGMDILEKMFKFDTYLACLDFARSVGRMAEEFDHHPRLVVEWGRVSVAWWTHAVSGLHTNDFIMAARTDRLG